VGEATDSAAIRFLFLCRRSPAQHHHSAAVARARPWVRDASPAPDLGARGPDRQR
jgi:hypothetical protein